MQKLREKFEERFYYWALQDWERELNNNFPFLRKVKCPISQDFITIAESQKEEQLKSMVKALVKRRRQKYLRLWGEHFTEKDKENVQIYFDLAERQRWIEASKIPRGGFPKKPVQIRLKRSKLKRYVVQELSPILGDNYDDWGRGEWVYETIIGQWKVMTYVDVGGQFHQLCYDHSIIVSESSRLIEGISLFSWLGIAGGDTMWQGLYDEDIEPTSKALATIIKHFMDAVTELLKGLSPDPICQRSS